MRQVKIFINASIIFILLAGTMFAADTLTGQNKNNSKKEPSATKPRKEVTKPGEQQSNATATISGISKKQHGDARKVIDNMKD